MRFSLQHVFAVVVLFSFLLAIGIASGMVFRDGVWTVESITTEDWGGSWHGRDPSSNEPTGGAILVYVATLRDGDRIHKACFGNSMGPRSSEIPQPGDLFVLSGLKLSADSHYLLGDYTTVLPAQSNDGYSPVINGVFAFVLSIVVVGGAVAVSRFLQIVTKALRVRYKLRQEARERYRRTHIV